MNDQNSINSETGLLLIKQAEMLVAVATKITDAAEELVKEGAELIFKSAEEITGLNEEAN
jgi:oligoribonuclease (3'-5' exoribonuclease)